MSTIGSFLTELLEDSGKVDLDMLSTVHWNLGVSDFLFTDFADALLEAFRTWGSRGDLVFRSVYCMHADIAQVLRRVAR